jgi:hypothetical protein
MLTANLDVSLGRDRISVSSRETGASVSRQSPKPFSSEHRLLADRDRAFEFVAGAIREVDRRPWFRKLFGRVTVRLDDGLNTQGDREDVRRLFVDLGTAINSID